LEYCLATPVKQKKKWFHRASRFTPITADIFYKNQKEAIIFFKPHLCESACPVKSDFAFI